MIQQFLLLIKDENKMETSKPPTNDESLTRHQFYTGISKDVAANAKDINGIGSRLNKLSKVYKTLHDLTQSNETRNKTLITVAVVAWAVIGGAISWYVQKSIANFDSFMSRVAVLEKKADMYEVSADKTKDVPDRLEAMKRSNGEIQRRLDDLEIKQSGVLKK